MTMIFLFESRKENLKYLSAAFLTVLPFFISILSVLFLGSIDRTIPPCQGFSGILAAFIGYGLYLLTKWSYGCFAHPFISNWDSIKKSMKIGGIIELFLVCAILAYLLDFGYNFGEFTANGGILANGIAHFGGFIIGIIVPLILGIVHDYKSRSNLVFSSIFILYTGIALFRYSQYIVELYRSIH
jgi:hypothetical protein